MEPFPKLTKFTIYFVNGNKIKHNIDLFYRLEKYIIKHGVSQIIKILFHFSVNNNIYYPYGVHNIVLVNENNNFIVIFYHYYDSFNILHNIHIEQQHYDYMAIIALLYSTDYINFSFRQSIINPFNDDDDNII